MQDMKLSIFLVVICTTYVYPSNKAPQKILNDLSWGVKLQLLKYPPNRRVGISMLTAPEETKLEKDVEKGHEEEKEVKPTSEDNSMKLKLFRLMYETVRDSELKVKRAELIKGHYTNYSSFEIGFILGDITDKLNVMTDISLTMKRLHKEWKPMEHINAYEQIANKGIEISHLVDMVKVINKKPLRY